VEKVRGALGNTVEDGTNGIEMPASPVAAYVGKWKEVGVSGGVGCGASSVSQNEGGREDFDDTALGSVQRGESFREIENGVDFRNPHGYLNEGALDARANRRIGKNAKLWFDQQQQWQQQNRRNEDVMMTGEVNRNFAKKVESDPFQDHADIEMSRLDTDEGQIISMYGRPEAVRSMAAVHEVYVQY